MESNATFDFLWDMNIESVVEEAQQGLGPTAWAPVDHPLEAAGTKVAFVGESQGLLLASNGPPHAAGQRCWMSASCNLASIALHTLLLSAASLASAGPDYHSRGVTSVRTNHPVPQDCQVYYFEVEVVGRDR